jgi:hypothetical protein
VTEHEIIATDIQEIIDHLDGVDLISPSSIASALFDRYAIGEHDPRIAYASREHLKNMARKALGRSFDTVKDAAETQGELFNGNLQPRYPVPYKPGEDRAYVRLDAMTSEQRRWNADRLLKAGRAFTLHGKALLAYDDAHCATASNDDAPSSDEGAA